jgi:hypothetical protein
VHDSWNFSGTPRPLRTVPPIAIEGHPGSHCTDIRKARANPNPGPTSNLSRLQVGSWTLELSHLCHDATSRVATRTAICWLKSRFVLSLEPPKLDEPSVPVFWPSKD